MNIFKYFQKFATKDTLTDEEIRQKNLRALQYCKTPKELNDALNKFKYGIVIDENVVTENIDYNKYLTISPQDFLTYCCGTCWDYTEFESWFFDNFFNYKFTKKPLRNGYYSLYYMQHQDNDNDMPSHAWLAYMKDNRVYAFESSWKMEQGIHEYSSEFDMLLDYDSKQRKCFEEEHLTKGLIFKYERINSYNLDVETFMKRIYINNGKVVKSDYKEYPIEVEALEHTEGFLDALDVVNSLSEEDKKMFGDHYKDSLNIVSRKIQYDYGMPIGFCDAYKNSKTNNAVIICAVKNEYRKKGVAKKLVNRVLNNLKLQGFEKAIWVCDKKNFSSIHTALACKFIKYAESKNQLKFIYELNG